MGPVTTESPRAVNMGQALKAASEDLRWKPKAWARVTVVGSAMAPAGLGVAVDAVGAGAEHGKTLALVLLQVERAGHDELLVAPAGARGAVHGYGDFADRDEAEARMDGAQRVEALEQVAGGVGVVPVVATVVDHGVVAGFFGQGAGVFDQVVAGEQDFEDRIAESLVFAAHGGGGGDAACGTGLGPWELGQEGRKPALVSRRFGQVFALKEGADGGRKFGGEVVAGEQFADLGDGGVVGRGGAGGERVERAQGHVGNQQADLGGVGRGHGQASALDGGEVLAEGIDLVDGRAGGEQKPGGRRWCLRA